MIAHYWPVRHPCTEEHDDMEESSYWRLHGTSGKDAVVGEVVRIDGDAVYWKLHPRYGRWFWPLMVRVVDLVLIVPKNLLDRPDASDSLSLPLPPSERETNSILQLADNPHSCVRVYTLRVPGKPEIVHKGFPTRLANLAVFWECRSGGEPMCADF